jgi:uncharacterized protein (TIGR02001 family)
MKKLLITLLTLTPLYISAHIGDLDISGNLTTGSDYLWRGVSQKGSEALSAGIDVEHGGFYAGAWVSEVDYGDNSEYEYDFYSGYTYNINDELSLDMGLIQYNFNDEPDNQLEEWYVGGSFKNFSAYYWRDLDDKANHFAEYSYTLPVDVVSVSMFYQDPVDFYGITTSKDIKNYTVSATYGQGRDNDNHEFVVGMSYNY